MPRLVAGVKRQRAELSPCAVCMTGAIADILKRQYASTGQVRVAALATYTGYLALKGGHLCHLS